MAKCIHWWQIGPPQPGQGPTSPGICQRCGEQREFRNYVEPANITDYRTKVTRHRKKDKDFPSAFLDSVHEGLADAAEGRWIADEDIEAFTER